MEKHLRVASVLANLMDNRFEIGGVRFGLDGILTLIPGAGDIVANALSFYLVWVGVQMKLPKIKLMQMLWNILINFLIGLVPILGDGVSFFYRSNMRNLAILKAHANKDIIVGELVKE